MRLFLTLLICVAFSEMATAQSRPTKPPADPCAPIGKTADGKLVYALTCSTIPVVTVPAKPADSPPPAAAAAEEDDQGGLFRNPFPSIIRPTNIQREPGVGPASGSR